MLAIPSKQVRGFQSVTEVLPMARSKLAVRSGPLRQGGAAGNGSMLVA